jgi:hypothetical protein
VAPPGVFDRAAVAYDGKRGRMVLFGGEAYPDAGATNDVWEYDGALASWSLLEAVNVAAKPLKQVDALAAHDPLRRRVLVYGGSYNEVPSLHAWDPVTRSWERDIDVGLGPLQHRNSAFLWDECRDRGVLFGGVTGDQLWEWNPETRAWSLATRAPGQLWPAPRNQVGFVFDSSAGRPVLFGGRSISSQTVFDDLWQWNGGGWEQLGPPPSETRPPPRASAGVAYVAWGERILVFGGAGADGSDLRDLWEWQRY